MTCPSTGEWDSLVSGESTKVDSKVDSIVLCGLLCDKRGEECEAFHYHQQTKVCTMAKVSCIKKEYDSSGTETIRVLVASHVGVCVQGETNWLEVQTIYLDFSFPYHWRLRQ